MKDYSFSRRGLQYLELHLIAHFKPGTHAEGQRDVGARNMAGTQTIGYGNPEIADDSQHNFLQCVILA